MNKSELVDSASEKSSLSKADVAKVVKGLVESVEEALSRGEKVQLIGFGTFESRARAAREGTNPRTREPLHINASILPVFKAGKEFKKMVNI